MRLTDGRGVDVAIHANTEVIHVLAHQIDGRQRLP